ncbi:hypothetical protein BJ875DRAFT_477404 [Amylocarpus encephaloides]|uniref:Uncharacterized protein n=1 Tax=Amylocarpus encephaloides TaxID=45428 RepID=A0A9P7Y761_9HELO|nr:hypothetical protein BJ875DRAFT_477404 [Amylocarpus encephaloides]
MSSIIKYSHCVSSVSAKRIIAVQPSSIHSSRSQNGDKCPLPRRAICSTSPTHHNLDLAPSLPHSSNSTLPPVKILQPLQPFLRFPKLVSPPSLATEIYRSTIILHGSTARLFQDQPRPPAPPKAATPPSSASTVARTRRVQERLIRVSGGYVARFLFSPDAPYWLPLNVSSLLMLCRRFHRGMESQGYRGRPLVSGDAVLYLSGLCFQYFRSGAGLAVGSWIAKADELGNIE